MILRRLKVSSFAGLANADLELFPGLNVILGPNEAGKSTLFHALEHTLLTTTRLTKPRFQRTVAPYLPAGGGDTIGTELLFEVRGRSYRVSKRWGASPQAELELPDGSRLTADETIHETLGGLLPVGEATLRAVFLTYQAGLASTLRELGEHPEALHSLSDLLRRSLLESGGVSIGRFQDLLDQRMRHYLEHWDTERRQPESGRGWDNPWKKGVGSVLEAYYNLQSLEARHRGTLQLEESYEERIRLLESCRQRVGELEALLDSEAPVVQDAERRALLESQREAAAVRLEALEKSYAEWTGSLLVREQGDKERAELLQTCSALEAERAEAESYARSQALRESYDRARVLKERWESAQSALHEAVELPREAMEKLRAAAGELQRLEGALAGGALSLRLEARNELDLSVIRDLEKPQEQRLKAGATWELEARGRVRLEHKDWSLEVTTAEAGFGEIAKSHEQARRKLQSLLETRGVASLEAAEQAHGTYARLLLEAEAARRSFEEALNGKPWDSLEAAARELPPIPPRRELGVLLSELAEAKARLGRIDESIRAAAERIASLERAHESREALLRGIGQHTARFQELERELAGLRALPPGYSDAKTFLERHRRDEQEAQQLREQKAGLESALQEATRHLPEESSEELASQLEEARRHFEGELRRAEALLRVRELTDGLLGSLDDSTMEGFHNRFGEYVRALSSARYGAAQAEALLPEALQREDGTVLRYELLSAGTRDLFSLALRLAMAEFFLAQGEDGDGFLVMDDPLVDLDPGRQKLAASELACFAERQQLVVFTCHPSHADLLSAARAQSPRRDRPTPIHRIELSLP